MEIQLLRKQLQQQCCAANGHVPALESHEELLLALESPGAYLLWLSARMPGLNRDELLEINELLPQWDGPIHRQLLRIERDVWRGFIRPLVNALVAQIRCECEPQVVLDVGAGAMEIERQVIYELLQRPMLAPVTLIGLDESRAAIELARENLASLGDAVEVIESTLAEAVASRGGHRQLRVVLCRESAEAMAQLPDKSVDLLLHSFVKHHLTMAQRDWLDTAGKRVARHVLEYDGYRNWASLLSVSALMWNHPAFLSAFIMSHARFETRRELLARHRGADLRFLNNGCYLCRQ